MLSKRMVPEQEVSELSDEVARLLGSDPEPYIRLLQGKLDDARAEIAALTEQRDRAMKVVEAAQLWAREYHDARIVPSETPSEVRLFNAVVGFNSLAALDAEAAAETAPPRRRVGVPYLDEAPDNAMMTAAMRAGCDTISDMCNFPQCAKAHPSLGGSASCWSHYTGRVRLALNAVAAQLAAPEIADIDAATGSADDRGLYHGAALDTQTAPSLPETP